MENTDRAWAEVSKEAILHNYAIVKSKIAPQASVMGILKADGYGHDIVCAAQVLEECGVDWIGVATFPEAVNVRAAGVKTPILMFSRVPLCDVISAAERHITVAS